MTVIEALRKSIEILNGVSVPVGMIQQVGMPITSAVSMIQACRDALERQVQPKETEPEGQDNQGADPEEGAEDNDERTDV